MTGYTLAVCISTGQRQCNIHLPNVTDTCYESLEVTNRTVNVILVNYPESNVNPNTTVVQLALGLNERNVEKFLVNAETTSGETTIELTTLPRETSPNPTGADSSSNTLIAALVPAITATLLIVVAAIAVMMTCCLRQKLQRKKYILPSGTEKAVQELT